MSKTAFLYQMPLGIPGDVNRMHPASIDSCKIDLTHPPVKFGLPVIIDPTSQAARSLIDSDTAVDHIWGTAVRPYPYQVGVATNYGAEDFGGGTPPLNQPIDIMRSGYMTVSVVGTPVKGGRVFIWIAADSGAHKQGGFEAVTGGGSNTIELTEQYYFNGSPDADGNCEIVIAP